jgi:muramidase (phage lysozyme)
MTKVNSILTTALLISSFSNSVFAENSVVNVSKEIEDSLIGLKQTKNTIIQDKNATADAMVFGKDYVKLNTKTNFVPKPEKPRPIQKPEKPISDKPQKTVAEKQKELGKDGKLRRTNLPNQTADKFNSKIVRIEPEFRFSKKGVLQVATSAKQNLQNSKSQLNWRVASSAEIKKYFFVGKNITQLSAKENAQLKERLGSIINAPNIKKFLITIRIAEHGGGLVIVGKGSRKPQWIKDKIAKLNYDSHPAEQLPRSAFPINKRYGLVSTASGEFQIVYSTFKPYKERFGFNKKGKGSKNFAVRNQRIVALDLARTSNNGIGFYGLMQGKLDKNTFCNSTQPWESSSCSTLGKGKIKTIDYYKLSQTEKVAKQVATDKDV